MTTAKIVEGTWAGNVKYSCSKCEFDSTERNVVEAHIEIAHPVIERLPVEAVETGQAAEPVQEIPPVVESEPVKTEKPNKAK